MSRDIRQAAAKFYDAGVVPFEDIPFYLAMLPFPEARVLELGCGTGRVLLPVAANCGFIQGLDASEAMLALCQEKLDRADLPSGRAQIAQADITQFDLGESFDLITAPFRVMQNIETDAEIAGLMGCIRRHLVPGGTAILNAFHPYKPAAELIATWREPEPQLLTERTLPDGTRHLRFDHRRALQEEPLVCYPDLIYRVYDAVGALTEETTLSIAMRCWYPDTLSALIKTHGFRTLGKWGGYAGETWGEGRELVIQFGL